MKSVCLNGTFVEPAELADPLSMLERNHLFQRIHTFGGTAPFLSVHLEILTRALNRLYGMQTDLSESRIADRIARLLEINRFPRQSACVTLRLFPEGIDEGSDRCEYLIETDRPLLYPHFVLWHKRMMLDTVRCDAPHEGYPTAGALLCDRYAERTVRRRGGELAARESRDGVLLGVGGEPLLIVSGRQALTTPLSAGATDSAMRRLVLSACREEGLTVTEYPRRGADGRRTGNRSRSGLPRPPLFQHGGRPTQRADQPDRHQNVPVNEPRAIPSGMPRRAFERFGKIPDMRQEPLRDRSSRLCACLSS